MFGFALDRGFNHDKLDWRCSN